MARCAALLAIVGLMAWGQDRPTKTLEVPGDRGWVDTGIDVQPGDLILFESSGELKYPDSAQPAGPDGLSRGWRDLMRAFPVNDAGRGAVVGRVNQNEASRPFLVGARRESRMIVSGRLFLGINQDRSARPSGRFQVKLTLLEKGGELPEYTGPLPKITEEILAKIPRRVVDPDGTPGDRVNFLVVGAPLERVKTALLSVGWVTVDASVKDTILRGALATLSRQAYLTIPMSPLMVFDRVQDYGFAMSDPVMTVAERHHFRVWDAPFQVEGMPLIVGAGTHDVGFDRDQRTGGITHRIDPDTDKERDFIGDSLKHSGQVVKLDYVTPKDTVTKAKTAHGQEFFSDGRILVIYMRPDETNVSQRFGDYFCSVMKQNSPDGEGFDNCAPWIRTPGKADLPLHPLSNAYRVLVVPGILNTCVDAQAFDLGRKVTGDKYGLKTDLLSVPNESSETNARQIADWIREESNKDERQFILVGYSKGTPDIQTALALYPEIRPRVAAFISAAGASGGSPIADALPEQAKQYLRKSDGKMNCEGDLSRGFESLKTDVRVRFLASYPHPYVPTYSLVAVADEKTIPSTSRSTWKMLQSWEKENDGQLLRRDAIVPESKLLGVVNADHLGVALAMGDTKFPRAALFEAMLRLVLDDLKAPAGSGQPADTKSGPAAAGSWADAWGQKKQ